MSSIGAIGGSSVQTLSFITVTAQPLSTNGSPLRAVAAQSPAPVWIAEIHYEVYILTTNDASDYWSITLMMNGVAGPLGALDTLTTAALAPGSWQRLTGALNVKLDPRIMNFEIQLVKTGTPGNIFVLPLLLWRAL